MLVGGADKAWPRMPLAIFSAERASRTHYNRRGDPSCDLEPISWEYAPMKHHDTGVLLAWLVTRAIVALRDRPLSSSKPFGQTCWPLWSSKRVCDARSTEALGNSTFETWRDVSRCPLRLPLMPESNPEV